ncbi:MAG: ParB/RepB/Spo0J family partition protein [Thermoanaerobaculia bacterium]
MSHDSHFVESLSARFEGAIGRSLPIEAIETNPDQPRTNVGDLEPLRRSIEARGVLEPLLVRPLGKGRYRIIAGERRFRAALEAGLTEVPCIELDIAETEVLEIALIENLHRRDLHPFEEAEGYASLARQGYTQQQIADAVGKSRVAVTETLSLQNIPESVREQCRRADILHRSVLLEIARLKDPGRMKEAVRAVIAGSTREDLRTRERPPGHRARRARHFSFVYKPRGGPFQLNLSFQKSHVEKTELIEALRQVLKHLEAGEIRIPKP